MKKKDQKKQKYTEFGADSCAEDPRIDPALREYAPQQSIASDFPVATRLVLDAAASQFIGLTRFEAYGTDALTDPFRASAGGLTGLKDSFIHDGVVEIIRGRAASFASYLHAVDVIRKKAAALGYGPEADAVPIDYVTGGYVGRFGGHDIYAAD